MKRIMVVVGLALVLVGITACQPPAPSITAKPDTATARCGQSFAITGAVTPPATSPTVVLQRTVNGQWVDAVQTVPDGGPAAPVVGTVASTGKYTMSWFVWNWTSNLHLRVRTATGGLVSPSFYEPIDKTTC